MSKTTTPIYAELITEAKRRTKRDSPERRSLTDMDEQTRPKKIAARTAARQTIGPGGVAELTRSKRMEVLA